MIKRMFKILKNRQGQTLVEISVALTIMSIIAISMLSVVVASKNLLFAADDRTKANFLAQEGIEIARHQRDVRCEFSSLVPDNVDGSTYHVIQGDTIDPALPNPDDQRNMTTVFSRNDPLITHDPTHIAGYEQNPTFDRRIYIYDLQDLAPTNAWIAAEFGGGPQNDTMNMYYLVKVDISWAGRFNGGQVEHSVVSSILHK